MIYSISGLLYLVISFISILLCCLLINCQTIVNKITIINISLLSLLNEIIIEIIINDFSIIKYDNMIIKMILSIVIVSFLLLKNLLTKKVLNFGIEFILIIFPIIIGLIIIKTDVINVIMTYDLITYDSIVNVINENINTVDSNESIEINEKKDDWVINKNFIIKILFIIGVGAAVIYLFSGTGGTPPTDMPPNLPTNVPPTLPPDFGLDTGGEVMYKMVNKGNAADSAIATTADDAHYWEGFNRYLDFKYTIKTRTGEIFYFLTTDKLAELHNIIGELKTVFPFEYGEIFDLFIESINDEILNGKLNLNRGEYLDIYQKCAKWTQFLMEEGAIVREEPVRNLYEEYL